MLDVLHDADSSFIDPARGKFDPATMAMGYRHLTHLLSYAFDLYVESDPDRPAFVPLAAPTKKILGDNTDSVYQYAGIRGGRAYRVSGQRGDDCYLSLIVHAGPDPSSSMTHRTVSNRNHTELTTDGDGRFEIILSEERPAGYHGDWMATAPDAVCVITREYYFDRTVDRPASWRIETVDPVEPPRPLSQQETADRLLAAAHFVAETVKMSPMPATTPNTMQEPYRFTPQHPSWGTPDNVYARCRYELEADEALVIDGVAIPCVYWGVQLWNPMMQSLDWRYERVSINTRQAQLGPGGEFRVVVSQHDPGVANWVSTAGTRQGSVFCRWLCPDAQPPTPTARVVKLADVATLAPRY